MEICNQCAKPSITHYTIETAADLLYFCSLECRRELFTDEEFESGEAYFTDSTDFFCPICGGYETAGYFLFDEQQFVCNICASPQRMPPEARAYPIDLISDFVRVNGKEKWFPLINSR